jgi:hypothetical protein
MRNPKKHLSFGSLRHGMSHKLRTFPDARRAASVDYSVHDVVMSGLAMMHFQDRSLLQFQKHLEDSTHRSNLTTLFGIKAIPKDTQIRSVLDTTESEQFRPIFYDFFYRLQRGKQLDPYQLFPNLYLCSIDGSEYFGSHEIGCPRCLQKTHKVGEPRYSHQILQAALMHPDQKQVIPLMPEEISNTDGTEKQDCEINAAKRMIRKIRKDHPQLGLILNGDGLFSKQPFIRAAAEERMKFIFVSKPDDHKILMEWVNEQRALGEVQTTSRADEKGRTHHYSWINAVPLNGNKDTILVNYFEYQLIVPQKNGSQKVTYKNSWVTDFDIQAENIETLVRGGRCRWKIENECFNTLKNQGYHIEHNYGHGMKNLSFNFFILNLLAFFIHQILELTDELYQACRIKNGSKKNLWEGLRHFIRLVLFETWESLMKFSLNPPQLKWEPSG